MRRPPSELSLRLLDYCAIGIIIAIVVGLLAIAAGADSAKSRLILPGDDRALDLYAGVIRSRAMACAPEDVQCIGKLVQFRQLESQLAMNSISLRRDFLVLDDYAKSNAHRIHTLWAHYTASWILLLVVVGIVVSGLYMSFLQLRVDLATQRPNANSFELSKDGLKLNSPVIGLLIFLAATYFFSVYVEKIYPVTFVRANENSPDKSGKPEAASSPASASK